MKLRSKIYFKFLFVVALALFAGVISYPRAVSFVPPLYTIVKDMGVNLGLDLQGGIHLDYAIDLSQVDSDKQQDALDALQAVVERRVNAFGVGEPRVQISRNGEERFLVVELPGIDNVEQAKATIKATPFLEFREEKSQEKIDEIINPFNEEALKRAKSVLARVQAGEDFALLAKEVSDDPGSKEKGGELGFIQRGTLVPEFDAILFDRILSNGMVYRDLVETQFGWHIIKKEEERGDGEKKEISARHILIAKLSPAAIPALRYEPTKLTGKYLKRADAVFGGAGQSGGIGIDEPQVSLQFDSDGSNLFADITKRNLGKTVAIFLDNELISAPVVQSEITNGQAVITGNFTLDEAKELAQRLNEGALPVPITNIGQQSVEASLGQQSLKSGVIAGALGLAITMLYLIFYYRFLGIVAAIALAIYTALMVTLFKLSLFLPQIFHITLTLSGIGGFILSVGMAVDANILIFERTREELRRGKDLYHSLEEGFHRAWPSIRDGNFSTIITSVILMLVGTGFIKGFAIILILGVLVSMFTAIILVKAILKFVAGEWIENRPWLVLRKK